MGLAYYSPLVVKSQQIGVVIRAAREKADMSQQSLAHLAGTTLNAVSEIELGKRNPGWSTLARIAAVLQVPASELDTAIEYEVAAARSKAPQSPQEARALREQQERMRKRHTER